MEIVYENRPEDIQYALRSQSRWKVLEARLTAPLLVFLSAVPACSLLIASRFSSTGYVMLLAMTGSAFWILWKTRHLFRAGKAPRGRVRMWVTPSFLEVEHAEFRSRLSWLAIEAVQRVDDAIVVLQPLGRSYIIREQFFASPAAAQQFLEMTSSYLAAAREIDPAVGDRSILPAWTNADAHRSVSYQNTIAQWTWSLKTFGRAKKSWLGYLYPISFAFLSTGLLALLIIRDAQAPEGQAPFSSLLEMLLLLLLPLASIAYTFSTLLLLRELANRLRIPPSWLEPRTLDIYPQGFVSQSPRATSAVRWPVVGDARRNNELLCINDLAGVPAIIVPVSAFPDEEAAEAFLADMVAWNSSAIEAANVTDDELVTAEVVDDANPFRSPHA